MFYFNHALACWSFLMASAWSADFWAGVGALFTTVLAVVSLVSADTGSAGLVSAGLVSAGLVTGVAELHGHFGSYPHSSSFYLMVKTAFWGGGQSHFLAGSGLQPETIPPTSKSSREISNPYSNLSSIVHAGGSPPMMSLVILSIRALVNVLVSLTRVWRAFSARPPDANLAQGPQAGFETGQELLVEPLGVKLEVKLMFFESPPGPRLKDTGLPVSPFSPKLVRLT